jgi:phage N-6-adenine-methyltransferase
VSRPGTEVSRNNCQTYGTPSEFLRIVQTDLGEQFGFDAAASADNAVCAEWSGDSLGIEWPTDTLIWLNPPFGAGNKFAAKCGKEKERGARVVGLFLAAVGSKWWAEHVHGKARVYFLSPRLTFVGQDQPFNRDLVLLVYDKDIEPGYECWRWKPRKTKAGG